MKRKICVITGTRADYGIFNPLLKRLKKSKRFELLILATGMHLMKEFGYTLSEIEKDGFKVQEKINISYSEDSGLAMAGSVGKAIGVFASSFTRLKPDLVVVLGDRGEMLAAAIAANYLNIPIAHLHGGEISGHVDGILRHALTKLAHLHFPATQKAKERILKLGEESWRVHWVGALALDRILREKLPTRKELEKKLGLPTKEQFLLLLQHPVLAEENEAADQINTTLAAIRQINLPTIVIYPNADAGGRRMIVTILKANIDGKFKVVKNLPHSDYLGLLKSACVLIGNSSSGLIEAPSFGLPVVNLGSRQDRRERGKNVIDAMHDHDDIIRAIKKALSNKFKLRLIDCKNPYGDGRAAERIVQVLHSIVFDKKFSQKQITY